MTISDLGQEALGKVHALVELCERRRHGTFTPFTRSQSVNAPSPRIATGIMKGARWAPIAGDRKFVNELMT